MVGQHRSTQCHAGKVVDIVEGNLRCRICEIAGEHIHWGRRMAYPLLRREDWPVNHKRVQRLWQKARLQRPTRRKRKGHGPPMSQCGVTGLNTHQVWAMHFQFDPTADVRKLKFMNVIDVHSRRCLAIRVGSLKGQGRRSRVAGAQEPIPDPSVHPIGQPAGVPCPGCTGLERRQKNH